MASKKVMSRREFGAVAAVGGASLCSWVSPPAGSAVNTVERFAIRGGVSLAGAEFGAEKPTFSNLNPGVYGRDYDYPDQRTVEYFAAAGLGLLRIPFRWERLQPNLGQRLDAAELGRLREVVNWATAAGALVVLDTHNYGRYQISLAGRVRNLVIDEPVEGTVPVSRAHFADYWRRVAEEFADDEAVVGLGLMNEPHDMGHSDWKAISQAAVEAVRSVDRDTYVIVAGNGWSSAERFAEINGANAWITDPADRVLYEAHCYFDADGSGKYRRSFADEYRDDPRIFQRGVKRVGVFLDWCHRNRVNGFLGEFGIPGASAGWREVMGNMLESLEGTDTLACYWAAGDWWNDYPLSVQPRDNMTQPAPQLEVLRRWLARRSPA